MFKILAQGFPAVKTGVLYLFFLFPLDNPVGFVLFACARLLMYWSLLEIALAYSILGLL